MGHDAFTSDFWPFDGTAPKWQRTVPHKKHWDDLRLVLRKLGDLVFGTTNDWDPDGVYLPEFDGPGWSTAAYRNAVELILTMAGNWKFVKVDPNTYQIVGIYTTAAPSAGYVNIFDDIFGGTTHHWPVPWNSDAPAERRFLDDIRRVLDATCFLQLPGAAGYCTDGAYWPDPPDATEYPAWGDLKAQMPGYWTNAPYLYGAQPYREMCGWVGQTLGVDYFVEHTAAAAFYDRWAWAFPWKSDGKPGDLGGINVDGGAVTVARSTDYEPYYGSGAHSRGSENVEVEIGGNARGSVNEHFTGTQSFSLAAGDIDALTGAAVRFRWANHNLLSDVPPDGEYPAPGPSIPGFIVVRRFYNYFYLPWNGAKAAAKVNVQQDGG